MRARKNVFTAASIAAVMLAWGSTGAGALVIPGTPEYEARDVTHEVPSYYRGVRISYRSAEEEAVDEGRDVRIIYPGRSRRGHRRDGSLLERARRNHRVRTQAPRGHSASPASSGVNYRNSSRDRRVRQSGSTLYARGYPRSASYSDRTIYGTASWYGWDFHGRRTANGEVYNMYDLTAAHRTLPFGTHVRVTNLRNGKQTTVRINDRGPFVGGREIDLSYATARDLGMLQTGVESVRLEIL